MIVSEEIIMKVKLMSATAVVFFAVFVHLKGNNCEFKNKSFVTSSHSNKMRPNGPIII